MTNTFADRYAVIQQRVEAAAQKSGRSADLVRVLAVAKTATPESLHQAFDQGQRLYAHNRVQALQLHFEVLPTAEWHLIGPLQRNKARKAVSMAKMVHTLTCPKLGQQLDRCSAELRPNPLPVLVQVNLTPEDGRIGLTAEELPAFLDHFEQWPYLSRRGLMTMAPQHASDDSLRRHFASVRELADQFQQQGLLPSAPELSMGMSSDFEIAIEEGATLVRIGRALFPPAP